MLLDHLSLVDERGQPFNARLHGALRDLVPRLQRDFPALNDPTEISAVLEQAGRRIAAREQRLGTLGPVEQLRGYAWVTLRRAAAARLQQSGSVVARASLGSEKSTVALATTPSRIGTSEQVEAAVLLGEVMARLTVRERAVCQLKLQGWSAREIAQRQGTSVSRVNTLFFRLGQKLRNLAGGGTPHVKRHTQEMRRVR